MCLKSIACEVFLAAASIKLVKARRMIPKEISLPTWPNHSQEENTNFLCFCPAELAVCKAGYISHVGFNMFQVFVGQGHSLRKTEELLAGGWPMTSRHDNCSPG